MATRIARRWYAWLLVPAMALTPLVVSLQPARADLVQQVGGGKGSIDWTTGTIKVTGTGAPPDKGTTASKRLMALRAARVDALRQLGEIVNGVKVDSETVVKDFVTESDTIRTQMSALIKGAQQAGEPRYLSDGSVEIDLVLPMYGQGNVADIIQPQKAKTPPKETKVEPVEVSEAYTGVIIDCQGLGAQPAMSPSIMDTAGGEIYLGKQDLGESFADFVIEHGIVAYAKSKDEARKIDRVGRNPLLLRASKITGKFKADAVLDNASAQKLLGADDKSKLLANAKVVFVL
jgi:hypothetical protein